MSTLAQILGNLSAKKDLHFSTQGKIDAIRFHYAARIIAQGC